MHIFPPLLVVTVLDFFFFFLGIVTELKFPQSASLIKQWFVKLRGLEVIVN